MALSGTRRKLRPAPPAQTGRGWLERNVVVQILARPTNTARGCGAALLHGRGAAELAATRAAGAGLPAILVVHRPAALVAAVEQRELAPEALQHHLCGLAFLAVLVGEFASLELAFQVNLRA